MQGLIFTAGAMWNALQWLNIPIHIQEVGPTTSHTGHHAGLAKLLVTACSAGLLHGRLSWWLFLCLHCVPRNPDSGYQAWTMPV